MTRTYLSFLLLVISASLYAQDWEFTGGPGGDILYSMTVTPNGDLYLLSSALHRSTDRGKTWLRLAHEVPLATSSTISKLACKGNDTLILGTPSGVWGSVDRGNSWTHILSMTSRNRVDLGVASDGTIVYSNDSLMISNDNGITWHSDKRAGRLNRVFTDVYGNFFVFGESSSHRSTNKGLSWSRLVNGITPSWSLQDIKSLSNGSLVTMNRGEFFFSTDTGRTWIKRSGSTNYNVYEYARLAVAGSDSIFLIQSGGKISLSTDSALTWETFDDVIKDLDWARTNLAYANNELYVMHGVELWKRSLGAITWEKLLLPNGVVTCLAAHSSGVVFAGTTPINYGNFYYYYGKLWTLNGSEWRLSSEFDSVTTTPFKMPSALLVDSLGTVFASAGGAFLASTDRGASWALNQATFSSWATDMAANREGMVFLANGAEGVYRTSDHGLTWDQYNEGITDLRITAISASDHGVVFAVGPKVFYRSTNYGFTWEEINFPFISETENVRAVAHVGERVVVGADQTGVYFSSDNGLLWENHSNGLMLDTINEVLMAPDGSIFAATTTGIYEYTDSTQTWKSVSGNGLAGNILSLALGADGKVYAGTAGGGVYRSTKTYGSWFKSSVERAKYLPDDISIYPNPASTEIKINFKSGRPEKYRTAIYNLLGESILVSNSEETIDVSSLRSGQYFLRITTESYTQTLPLSIIK